LGQAQETLGENNKNISTQTSEHFKSHLVSKFTISNAETKFFFGIIVKELILLIFIHGCPVKNQERCAARIKNKDLIVTN
jgi:hypothetical protein